MADIYPAGRRVARDAAAVIVAAGGVGALAQIDVSLGAGLVPFSLQTFGVVLCGLALGPLRGALAIALYLAAGALGAPIFAEGAGGAGHLVGPTGGYLFGFIGCAWLTGRLRRDGALARCVVSGSLAGCAGHALIFAVGVPWLAAAAGLDAGDAVAAGMLPFLPGAALKSLAAALVWGLAGLALARMRAPAGAVASRPQGVSPNDHAGRSDDAAAGR